MRRHLVAGLGIVAMLFAMMLAHGITGVADGKGAGEYYIDQQLRDQVERDTHMSIVSDAGEDLLLAEAELRPVKKPAKPVKRTAYARDYRVIAAREARRSGIKQPALFVRQMAAESGYQPCAQSGAGALGIAQIMPATARSWGVDPHIPEEALRAAALHMARYERQLGSYELALAAYNAGPGAVRSYGGVPPYPETREYIRRVTHKSVPLAGMSQVYRPPTRMGSAMSKRLLALQRDVARHGGKLVVNEGWRSYEDSLRIWRGAKKKYGGWQKAKRWAAPPGCSNHVRGWAADVGGSLALARQLAPKHGLVFPMSWEPWHVEKAGIATQSG